MEDNQNFQLEDVQGFKPQQVSHKLVKMSYGEVPQVQQEDTVYTQPPVGDDLFKYSR